MAAPSFPSESVSATGQAIASQPAPGVECIEKNIWLVSMAIWAFITILLTLKSNYMGCVKNIFGN